MFGKTNDYSEELTVLLLDSIKTRQGEICDT